MEKKVFMLCLLLLFASVPLNSAVAQTEATAVEFGSSPNPVGAGARAMGMGGAFIGVADDATAASWNPGGLFQLKNPEISFVINGFRRTEDNTFPDIPDADGSQRVSETDLNYFSIAYPFNLLKRNMIVSLNYQQLYDFAHEWDFPVRYSDELPAEIITVNQQADYKQTGTLSALGLAYCIQVNPKFSFGVTLNFWDDGLFSNTWKEHLRVSGTQSIEFKGFPSDIPSDVPSDIPADIPPDIPSDTSEPWVSPDIPSEMPGMTIQTDWRRKDEYSFSGFNFNIGMLWRATDKLTVGLVFKSPFTADIRHKVTEENVLQGEEQPVIESAVQDEELDMPMSYGLGIAYRFSDRFTLSADIYRTEWDEFTLTDSDGNEICPITERPANESDIDPTNQIRVGAEYLFIHPEAKYVIPLRAGIFYDPAPADKSPDDFYGVSLGSGIAMGRYIFDIACQYRFGNDVGKSMVQTNRSPFSQDVSEYTIYSSLIIHF